MRRRMGAIVLAGLALAVVPGAGPVAGPVGTSASAPLRVMPLGASSTVGVGSPATAGYRGPLLAVLTAGGIAVDLVGSRRDGPATLHDTDHEGHSGATITDLLPHLEGWVRAAAPDVVLLHLGTNDLLAGADGATVAERLDAALERIHLAAPTAHVVVAGVWAPLPRAARRDAEFAALAPWVAARHRALGRSVEYVDTAHLLGPGDLPDGLHPDPDGYRRIAAMWAARVERRLAARPRPG
jgi:acyl-CoA thioesterase I